jgi:hypothetical protein
VNFTLFQLPQMQRYFPKNASGAATAAYRHMNAQEIPVEKRMSQMFGGGNVSTSEATGAGAKREDPYRK